MVGFRSAGKRSGAFSGKVETGFPSENATTKKTGAHSVSVETGCALVFAGDASSIPRDDPVAGRDMPQLRRSRRLSRARLPELPGTPPAEPGGDDRGAVGAGAGGRIDRAFRAGRAQHADGGARPSGRGCAGRLRSDDRYLGGLWLDREGDGRMRGRSQAATRHTAFPDRADDDDRAVAPRLVAEPDRPGRRFRDAL